MQGKAFSPRQGWSWLQTGFALWRSAPLPLTASASTLGMCLLIAAIVPYFGELVVPVLLPVLSVGMFRCCNAIASRAAIMPGLLFQDFGAHLRRLLPFAGLRLAGDLGCFFLALWISGVSLARFQLPAEPSPQAMQEMARAIYPVMGWTFLLRTPIEMATWFAAPLIALQRLPLGKALFFSFVACWRNLGALLVFLLGFTLCAALLPGLLVSLVPGLGSLLLAPIIMVAMPVFFAGYYVSAREIFGAWPQS